MPKSQRIPEKRPGRLGVLGRRAAWENAKKPAIPTDKGAVGDEFAPTAQGRTTIQLSLDGIYFLII